MIVHRQVAYVAPYRTVVVHAKCEGTSTLDWAVADTLARHPGFFSGLYCRGCRQIFAARHFYWLGNPKETLDGKIS